MTVRCVHIDSYPANRLASVNSYAGWRGRVVVLHVEAHKLRSPGLHCRRYIESSTQVMTAADVLSEWLLSRRNGQSLSRTPSSFTPDSSLPSHSFWLGYCLDFRRSGTLPRFVWLISSLFTHNTYALASPGRRLRGKAINLDYSVCLFGVASTAAVANVCVRSPFRQNASSSRVLRVYWFRRA